MKGLPLSESYRPKEFGDLIGIENKEFIKLLELPMELPSMLFYGTPGTGKTSLVKIILDKLGPVDVIRLNGSSKQDRNIETISVKVLGFASSKSSVPGKPKIIFIDEIDNLTNDAFEALRGVFEKVMVNARFIATANHFNKIPDAIKSRFTCFKFETATNEEILPRIKHICESEKIKVTDETLTKIIKPFKGDIRSIINNIQLLSIDGEIKDDSLDSIEENLTEIIYSLILEKNWTKIRYELPNKQPDYIEMLITLDKMFFENELEVEKKIEINTIIARTLYEMYFVFDKEICFSAACSQIIKII